MEGGTWERMVIVMPPLSESQQPDDPLVATPIVRFELAFAKGVTDRIDAPGHVVSEEGDHRVLDQVTAIHVWIGRTVIEEPAKMCMKESLYRAMRITFTVSLRVMFDVCCCPLKRRTLPRHGTED